MTMMCWERLKFLIGEGPPPEITRIETCQKRPDAACKIGRDTCSNYEMGEFCMADLY